jgi:hypothetical protein
MTFVSVSCWQPGPDVYHAILLSKALTPSDQGLAVKIIPSSIFFPQGRESPEASPSSFF